LPVNSVPRTGVASDLHARIAAFVGAGSTEITPHDEPLLPQLKEFLPPGATVYVAHPPRTEFRELLRVAALVERLGFSACPHVAAREVHSEAGLRAGLNEARELGIGQILLIAGDRKDPAGPYPSTLEILDSGVTVDCAIKSIGVAGHPEGNRMIGATRLWEALRIKQAFADRTGTEVRLVTQFGFNPDALGAWVRELDAKGIRLPVHFGLAGPTPLPKLIKFAMRCGIGASFNALMRSTSALAGVAGMATTPEEMVTGVVRGATPDTAARIVKPHFFCFGGLIETVRWMRKVREGAFDLRPDGATFELRR
jgi:methylenetetrahydrofolate reductase (NADPH)